MCGIAGFIDRRASTTEDRLHEYASAMTESLRHRGPDAGDIWVDGAAGVALGHRRLSIIDLTPTGAQPMASASGRYVMTYNGEVFNYRALRAELASAGCQFRGNSDTEVILEGVVRWGLVATLRRLIGMFAFALWDRETRALWLVRDRLGIKPLYYAITDGQCLFASELKAFRALPQVPLSLDPDALAGYLRFGYVPSPHSIYREVRKLPPGHVLKLAADRPPELEPFWDLRRIAQDGARASLSTAPIDDAALVDEIDALLRDAVRLRMISDVPLGAFLSGGIDSSTVVALMQTQSNRPIRTFSIGFHEPTYNEADHARRVAEHLGTAHTEHYVEPRDALDVIPRLADWYDEPFADSSQIPTYLVSAMTRRHVTVALSGDGGDEVFAGYNRYVWADAMWRRLRVLPRSVRRIAGALGRAVPTSTWDCVFGLAPAAWRLPQPGDKVHKFADVLGFESPDAIFRRLVSQWPDPKLLSQTGHEPFGPLWDETLARDIPNFTSRMQYIDTVTYLPDDILTKVDRATMAVSLEGRVPLLDHRVVERLWSLPPHVKVRHGRGKWLLRQILARYVPDRLVERPKMGFGVPIDRWLRGPLRDWAAALLSPEALAASGHLNPQPIVTAWREHLSGARNWQYPLWTVLMFQAWRERWT
jgi:asparagine synthase (glutamine-hydrolysing)